MLSTERTDRGNVVDHYRTAGYWYACGYNDNRGESSPWRDPQAFSDYCAEMATVFNSGGRFIASVQDLWTGLYFGLKYTPEGPR